MSALNQLLSTLKVEANVFHNGRYCGMWAIDTSGTRQMTFHVVSFGTCYLRVDDELLELQAGDAVFFPSDARHRVSNVSDETLAVNQTESVPMTDAHQDPQGTGLVCGYFGHQNPVFDKLLKQLPSSIVIRAGQPSACASVIDLLLQESLSSGQSTNLLLNRLSDCLLFLLLRDHLDTDSGVFSALVHPRLGKAMELIHGPIDKRLSVEELAATAAMSRSAFSALFKEIVDQSPIEYITQWRMTQAYRWLADDGISTLDAALRSGYETEASFAKAFKRVIGTGPGAVRRQPVESVSS